MEPTRINNPQNNVNGGYNSGYNPGGYNNGYNNMPPRKNNSSTALIIGIVAGVVLCGIVFLIVYLVNQNHRMEEKLEAVEQMHNKAQDNEDVQVPQVADDDEVKEETHRASSGILNSGRNVMKGSFNYAGSNYGFTVAFNYNASNGTASGGTYEADGYAGKTKVSVSISNGGRNITISGKSTYISLSSSGGNVYTGSMTRGTHNGSCRVTLR